MAASMARPAEAAHDVREDFYYLLLMYGRRDYDAPADRYDQTGGCVLGPFVSVAAEFVTRITVTPCQTTYALLASSGRCFSREHVEALPYPELTIDLIRDDSVPFHRTNEIRRLTLTTPGGDVYQLGDSVYYDGLWWGGFTLITAATFESADGWREHHEQFDPAKATPPETT